MCITEIYVDRYPDGSEIHFPQTRLCQSGRRGRPCDSITTITNNPRDIQYGEPTSEYIITQMHTPRSSTSSHRPSSFVEIIDERRTPPRPRRRRGSIFLDAFFGPSSRRHRSHREPSRERVVFLDTPPSPRTPRTPPPHYARPLTPLSPSSFRYQEPPRGRPRGPVIIDSRQAAPRSTSIEVVIGPRRHRSQSPTLSELRRQDEDIESERRRKRDERAARLAAELAEVRDMRERERRRARLDAEIMSRPRVPLAPTAHRIRDTPRPRPVIDQSTRLHEMLNDMHLSSRGERVIAEAVEERRWQTEALAAEALAERRRRDAQRMVQAGIRAQEEEAALEAQRRRLARRFTVGGGRPRRDRINYDDGSFRIQ